MKIKRDKDLLFVDLCCGAGGMSYGFRRAGWMPLLGFDNCPHSAKTYKANLKVDVAAVDLSAVDAYKAIVKVCNGSRPDAVIAGGAMPGLQSRRAA